MKETTLCKLVTLYCTASKSEDAAVSWELLLQQEVGVVMRNLYAN